jgi:isoleucyl-tRNA synthetase
MKNPREIAMEALKSATELLYYNRKPVLIRMHPNDIRNIRKEFIDVPRDWPIDGCRLWGYPLVPDEAIRRGEPVAEFAE